MKQDSLNTRNSKGRPRTRFGTKVLSIATAFALAMSMCPAVYANDQACGGQTDMETQLLVGQGEKVTINDSNDSEEDELYEGIIKYLADMYNAEE